MATLFIAFTLYPIVASLKYTFYDWNGIGSPQHFIGIQNYTRVLADQWFWNAFQHNLLYSAVLVPVEIIIALALAISLNTSWLTGSLVFRTLFFLPVVAAPAVVGAMATVLATTSGRNVNKMLMRTGLVASPIDWLGNPRFALVVLIGVGVWLGLGYPMIYFLAGLQSIDQEIYEAAKVDGAGMLALATTITIPLLRSVAVVILLTSLLTSLRVFDTVQVMTKGGPYFSTDVVSTYIYRRAFFSSGPDNVDASLGFASAAAALMSILIALIALFQVLAVAHVTTISNKRMRERDTTSQF